MIAPQRTPTTGTSPSNRPCGTVKDTTLLHVPTTAPNAHILHKKQTSTNAYITVNTHTYIQIKHALIRIVPAYDVTRHDPPRRENDAREQVRRPHGLVLAVGSAQRRQPQGQPQASQPGGRREVPRRLCQACAKVQDFWAST